MAPFTTATLMKTRLILARAQNLETPVARTVPKSLTTMVLVISLLSSLLLLSGTPIVRVVLQTSARIGLTSTQMDVTSRSLSLMTSCMINLERVTKLNFQVPLSSMASPVAPTSVWNMVANLQHVTKVTAVVLITVQRMWPTRETSGVISALTFTPDPTLASTVTLILLLPHWNYGLPINVCLRTVLPNGLTLPMGKSMPWTKRRQHPSLGVKWTTRMIRCLSPRFPMLGLLMARVSFLVLTIFILLVSVPSRLPDST
mmetsp:Transcript_8802/g.15904  ORF Transcript_8802/g.15904 Transcript_8802/m.15904 type:complete len:258 (-) Transcript_8802:214-987(-)